MALRVDWKATGDPVLDRLGRQFVEQVACHARGGSYAWRQQCAAMHGGIK